MTVGYLPQEVDLPVVAELHLAVMGVTPDLLACASEMRDLERKMPSATGRSGARARQPLCRGQPQVRHAARVRLLASARRRFCSGWGSRKRSLSKPVRTLSGGQKTRAALARLLLLSPDVLLLDEPTNHLDIRACDWLQEFLNSRYNGAALIVSHDQVLHGRGRQPSAGDRDRGVASYPGQLLQVRQAQGRADRGAAEALQGAEEGDRAARGGDPDAVLATGSSAGATARSSSSNAFERVELSSEKRTMAAHFTEAVRSGREVLRLSKLSKSYPGKELFAGLNYRGRARAEDRHRRAERQRQEHAAEDYRGAVGPDSGEVMLGHNVQPVYFAQEFDHLVRSQSRA